MNAFGLFIECILHREGGTRVELQGSTYHFAPQNDPEQLGRHIANITDPGHAQKLMGIPEAYRIAVFSAAPVPVSAQALGFAGPASAPLPPHDPAAAPTEPPAPPVPVENVPVQVFSTPPVEPVEPPVTPVAMPPVEPPAPVALPPDRIDNAAEPASTLPSEDELKAMGLEALRAQAAKELGRNPSIKAKEPLLIAQIMAKRGE